MSRRPRRPEPRGGGGSSAPPPRPSRPERYQQPVPASELLCLHVTADGEPVLLRVAGEIDVATGPRLCRALGRALDSGAEHVHVDLADVTFCDSTIVHALLHARTRAGTRGTTLTLDLGEWARRLLDITGTTHLFTLRRHPEAPRSADP